MNNRQVKKIVKRYGDSWWTRVTETATTQTLYWNPPKKWATQRVLDEFHRQHRTVRGMFEYQIPVFWYESA